MSKPNKIVESAVQVLDASFERVCKPSKYIDSFRTVSGREIAIERIRHRITVWTEPMLGHSASVSFGPDRNYTPGKPRNSNLNAKRTPRLKDGKPAWLWKLDSIEQLQELVAAYA